MKPIILYDVFMFKDKLLQRNFRCLHENNSINNGLMLSIAYSSNQLLYTAW